MRRFKKEHLIRLSLTLAILLSGMAMVPFINVTAEVITWQSLAGGYEPILDVNEPEGTPGSIFAFTGSSYPANALATVYANGEPLGDVMTDGSGVATFMVNTASASLGLYNVTLEVDINASATSNVTLSDTGSVVTPPAGFPGPTFNLGHLVYLPVVNKP